MAALVSLVFTTDFLSSLCGLSSTNQGRIFRALRLLDENDQHPSLNVHQLKGKESGLWAAYASKSLRITFRKLEGQMKELVEASQHYGD